MNRRQILCHECDLVVDLPKGLGCDEKLVCPRCHSLIHVGLSNAKQNVLAFAISSLFLLLIVSFFPFLTFEFQGRTQPISLVQTATAMYDQGYIIMSLFIYLFIFCFPVMYLLGLIAVIVCAQYRALQRLALESAKMVSKLLPWCMGDVFFTGVLVALIKIIATADIYFGVAFYSYLVFAVFFIYLTQVVDRHRLWNWYSEAFETDNDSEIQ